MGLRTARARRAVALLAVAGSVGLTPVAAGWTASAETVCPIADPRPATFAAPTQLAAGLGPWFVIGPDLNSDGRADLAVANSGSRPGVSLLLNTTARGADQVRFTAPVGLRGSGLSQQALAAADFNRDGRPDLAVGNFFTTDGLPLTGPGIDLFANTTPQGSSTPRLVKAASLSAGAGPEGFAVADFNGDGRADLANTDYGILDLGGTSGVSVRLNRTRRGSPTFAFGPRASMRVGSGPIGISAVDVNADGRPDLVVANNFTYDVSVLLNRTPVGADRVRFAEAVDFPAGSPLIGPETLATGDLSRDGRPDIVTPNFLSGGTGNVSVLVNRTRAGAATPRFASQQQLDAGIGPQHVAIGDLNGDRVADLAAVNYGAAGSIGTGVSVFTNQTHCGADSVTLADPTSYPAGALPTALVERDFNRDGRLDLAVSNHGTLGTAGVSVLLNTTR